MTEARSPASFGRLLRDIRHVIPRTLLAGEGWGQVLGCADRLPLAVAGLFGFECRLADEAPACGFAIDLPLHSPVSAHFIGEGERPGAQPEAAGLAGFLRDAEQPETFLNRFVSGAVVEYDAMGAARADPNDPPGLFLRLPYSVSTDGGDEDSSPAGPPPRIDRPGVIADALAAAVAAKPDAGERRQVERVFEALPPSARVVYLGMFPGRAPRAVRVVFLGVDAEALPAALSRLGWPGDPAAVMRLLDAVCLPETWFMVGVDVDETGVQPKLGLELKQGREDRSLAFPEADRMTSWKPLLEWLVANGKCRPEKAMGLEASSGIVRVFDFQKTLEVRKNINHIKLTFHGARAEAKAYVALQMRIL